VRLHFTSRWRERAPPNLAQRSPFQLSLSSTCHPLYTTAWSEPLGSKPLLSSPLAACCLLQCGPSSHPTAESRSRAVTAPLTGRERESQETLWRANICSESVSHCCCRMIRVDQSALQLQEAIQAFEAGEPSPRCFRRDFGGREDGSRRVQESGSVG
jgi:hypothetical protein